MSDLGLRYFAKIALKLFRRANLHEFMILTCSTGLILTFLTHVTYLTY
jgi:hypothetical protein